MPNEKTLLIKTARMIAQELYDRREGTSLKIRLPWRASATVTDGWSAVIGSLGKHKFRIEIWLDRFAGPGQRKFWFGFLTMDNKTMRGLANGAKKELQPHWKYADKDTSSGKIVSLVIPLKRNQYGVPYLEDYKGDWSFYGMYDVSGRPRGSAVSPDLCSRAVAFLESVARTLPGAHPEQVERNVYPREENRKVVESHLRRERSSYLATERKSKDQYTCQVCGIRGLGIYGKHGDSVAEAHHLVPLSQQREGIQTRIEDLRTVCANCHRVLHRMAGRNKYDFYRLRKLVFKPNRH